jgi:hypothetical protein
MRKKETKTPKTPKKQSKTQQRAAADTPPPVMLTPDEAVAQIRAMKAQLPNITSLTKQERDFLRNSARIPDSAIQASISVLDASDGVAHVVAQPADVRQMYEDNGHWATFENELKAMLQSVADANIVRRQRTRVIAVQAYQVGQQLSRTPGNEALEIHVKEVKRLRAAGRRKKPAPQTPQTPAPSGGTTPSPSPAGGNAPALATAAESNT